MPDLSIIITNWNGKKVLEDCLRSVFEKTKDISFEVIVVDDASSDESVEMVRSKFPNLRLIVNPQNLGFSEANNVGIQNAAGRYVLLLNNDTVLQNNAFEILVSFMDRHPETGIAGGTLLNLQGEPDISYGDFPSVMEAIHGSLFLDKISPHAGWVKRKGAIPQPAIKSPIDVDYICGADFLIRRELIEEVGLLDPRFRAYCEETDYCYRVRQTGKWRVVFVPGARIIHIFGSTWGPGSRKKVQLLYTSYAKYLIKHYNPAYALVVRMLYAWRYVIIFIVNLLRANINKFETETFRKKYQEAAWIVRYSLFPHLTPQ